MSANASRPQRQQAGRRDCGCQIVAVPTNHAMTEFDWRTCEIRPCPLHSPEADAARLEFQRAAWKIYEGFSSGIFVRSTLFDADPGWAVRLVPYMLALSKISGPEYEEPA